MKNRTKSLHSRVQKIPAKGLPLLNDNSTDRLKILSRKKQKISARAKADRAKDNKKFKRLVKIKKKKKKEILPIL